MSWTDELGENQWGTRSNQQSQGAQRREGKKKRECWVGRRGLLGGTNGNNC